MKINKCKLCGTRPTKSDIKYSTLYNGEDDYYIECPNPFCRNIVTVEQTAQEAVDEWNKLNE